MQHSLLSFQQQLQDQPIIATKLNATLNFELHFFFFLTNLPASFALAD